MGVRDTVGNKLPDSIKITLKEDAVAGVSLGKKDLLPGETAEVPYAIGARLIANGRAYEGEKKTAAKEPAKEPAK